MRRAFDENVDSWQDAVSILLDGCEEARRYVGNVLFAQRACPVDGDASGADSSDDLRSDEDLALSSESRLDALNTRIGGIASKETTT